MQDDPQLPLADNGKASAKTPSPTGSERPGLWRRLKLWRVPLLMIFLFTGAVVGMYFQPPLLRSFFGLTGLEPGAGSRTPIAVSPPPVAPVPEPAPRLSPPCGG